MAAALSITARAASRTAGRTQGALRLHGGEALVGRLDRDAERFERQAEPPPPRAQTGPRDPPHRRG